MSESQRMPHAQQFCTFYINEMLFGIDVKRVQEVVCFHELTAVPLAPPAIRGLINLRGQIIAAIDLRQRLEIPNSKRPERPMNVIVRAADGLTSLLVDAAGDVLETGAGSFERTPDTLRGVVREFVLGVHKLKDSLLLILDIDKVIQLQMPKRAAVTERDETASLERKP